MILKCKYFYYTFSLKHGQCSGPVVTVWTLSSHSASLHPWDGLAFHPGGGEGGELGIVLPKASSRQCSSS